MATDQSPPRMKLILTVAIVAPVILFMLKFVFDSYFTMMAEDAIHSKLAEPLELQKLREGEQKNLSTSQVPITSAMMELGKGRAEQGGPDLIQPQPSDDIGPLTGWSKLPRTFELPAGAMDAGASTMMAGDGGMTATMGDGGGAMLTTGDGGAPRGNAKDGGAPRRP